MPATGFHLLDHPNRACKQYRETRRNGAKLTGTAVVHSAENYPDTVGPDLGAENVAGWVARRTDPGSYHDLADSDSWVKMAPYEYEVWHDRHMNNWAYGLAGAFRAHDFDDLSPAYREATVENMGRAGAAFVRHMKDRYGIVVPIRRITQAQARRREPGFISHGESDPGRRSDPGPHFPWARFLEVVGDLAGSASVPRPRPTPPAPPATGAWPGSALPVTDAHTAASHAAWVKLLADVGFRDASLTVAMQKWLAKLGYYKGRIDDRFEGWTVDALQRFLRDKGHYRGRLDGKTQPYSIARGPLMVRAEIAYLNDQRRYYS